MRLAPTRELAIQIEESVETYATHTGLRSTVVSRRRRYQGTEGRRFALASKSLVAAGLPV